MKIEWTSFDHIGPQTELSLINESKAFYSSLQLYNRIMLNMDIFPSTKLSP